MAPNIFNPAACAWAMICRYPAITWSADTSGSGSVTGLGGVTLKPKSLIPIEQDDVVGAGPLEHVAIEAGEGVHPAAEVGGQDAGRR